MSERRAIDCVVLGATGYVAGETLRLLAHHPRFELRSVVARSSAGSSIGEVFPHLQGVHANQRIQPWEQLDGLLDEPGPLAVFSALPHGKGALLGGFIEAAQEKDKFLHVVDMAADFRHRSPERYEATYGEPHTAPETLPRFFCCLPDLERETPPEHVAHPGCFATAVSLACRPLSELGLSRGAFHVSAVTGSTGSGREPKLTTHHPLRHGNMRAYGALKHRHVPEMEHLVGWPGREVDIAFVPHSGPFARGIHATVHFELAEPLTASELARRVELFYAWTPFVTASDGPPNLKDVIGTNRCHLGFATHGKHGVAFSVIDNLTKGAAGGAVQWMNRLFGMEAETGLELPGLGWN